MNMGQQKQSTDRPEVSAYDPDEVAFSVNSYELHPDGKYKAKATDLKTRVIETYGKPQKQIGLVFTTEHVQENGENGQLIKWGSPSLDSRAFFAKYILAIGEDLEAVKQLVISKQFDARKYLNKSCTVIVVHEPRKDGDGDYAKIASVNAPDKKKAAAPTAPPSTERPNFDDDDD